MCTLASAAFAAALAVATLATEIGGNCTHVSFQSFAAIFSRTPMEAGDSIRCRESQLTAARFAAKQNLNDGAQLCDICVLRHHRQHRRRRSKVLELLPKVLLHRATL